MQTIIAYIPRIWKAITAAASAGAFTYGSLQVDGVTLPEWGYLAVAVLVAGFSTWKVSNASPASSGPGTVGTEVPGNVA